MQYIMGELKSEEHESMRQKIERDSSLQELYQDYLSVHHAYQQIPILKTGPGVEKRFQDWLDKEANASRHSRNVSVFQILKYAAAACVILAVGAFLGTKYLSEYNSNADTLVSQTVEKAAILQLINTESTTNRIKGIQDATAWIRLDPEVRDVLIATLKHDQSSNVRLAAVEALSRDPADEVVKSALIDALKHEKEPAVQISIINTLVFIGERRAKESLEELLENENIEPFVKDEARLNITRM